MANNRAESDQKWLQPLRKIASIVKLELAQSNWSIVALEPAGRQKTWRKARSSADGWPDESGLDVSRKSSQPNSTRRETSEFGGGGGGS